MVASNIVSILTELVQPFVFLHSYGTGMYADWIVLSAAVAYLSNLNFGLQTFINQDLAVRYNRGEFAGYHVQQSTALRILIGIVAVAAGVCLIVFVLPVERLLHLSLSHGRAATTLYLIALQILIGNLIFTYFAGNFMGVGLAHRGTHWQNAQRLATTVLLTTLAWERVAFPVLAGAQLVLYLLFVIGVLIDLRYMAPDIFPTLRHWDHSSLGAILKPSGYFGLIYWSTFLSFQLPVILLQQMIGPTAVVIFTLMRKIFGLVRQVLNGITQSMGPEITRLYGAENWNALFQLYDSSERLIFFLISSVNPAVFFCSPLLLLLWMHKPGLFELVPYLMMCAVSIVLCVKEHKYQFQFSSNNHIELARMMFWSYIVMTVVSIGAIHYAGMSGLLGTWLVTEIFQAITIMRMNRGLFQNYDLRSRYIWRLTVLGVCSLACGYVLLRYWQMGSYWAQIARDTGLISVITAVAFYVFQISDLSKQLRERLASRFGR